MSSTQKKAILRKKRQLMALDKDLAYLWWRHQLAEDYIKPIIEKSIEQTRIKREEICSKLTSLTS